MYTHIMYIYIGMLKPTAGMLDSMSRSSMGIANAVAGTGELLQFAGRVVHILKSLLYSSFTHYIQEPTVFWEDILKSQLYGYFTQYI